MPPALPLGFGIVQVGFVYSGFPACKKEDGDDGYPCHYTHDETEDCPTPFFDYEC